MVAAFHILSYMIFSIYESTIENYGRLTPKLASEMGFAFAIVALFMGGNLVLYACFDIKAISCSLYDFILCTHYV